MFIAYTNTTVYSGEEILAGKAVLTENGKVGAIVNEEDIPAHFEIRDLQGNNLAPSFIDLQIYGGNGQLFAHHLSVESLEKTYDYCRAGGCAHFMITISTNPPDIIYKGIEVVKAYWQKGGKGLLGLHLEGPYINAEKRGAHKNEFVRKPVLTEMETLLAAGKEVIKMITLAPELCEDAIIHLLNSHHILVSAGHSNASYPEAMHGFERGIPLATHLFNAMSPLQSRAPGMVGAIYDDERVMCSIVADGVHVDFAAVRISKKIMQHRLFLITDAVTEIKEGYYHHLFAGDRYTLPDGTLSGSALTMMKAVKHCVEQVGIETAEAMRMASLYPARAARLDGQLGYIKPGYTASFVVFDNEFSLKELIG
jgi:N-acetylglucosamine-6-phosphate deacetylase